MRSESKSKDYSVRKVNPSSLVHKAGNHCICAMEEDKSKKDDWKVVESKKDKQRRKRDDAKKREEERIKHNHDAIMDKAREHPHQVEGQGEEGEARSGPGTTVQG